jgi:hypothetical protein
MGWSAVDRERPMSGPSEARGPAGWPVGEAQCTAPQAESDVIVLATTANGFSGHAAPHVAREPTWPGVPRASTGYRRRAGS